MGEIKNNIDKSLIDLSDDEENDDLELNEEDNNANKDNNSLEEESEEIEESDASGNTDEESEIIESTEEGSEVTESTDKSSEDESNSRHEHEIILIQKENIEADDPIIGDFITFCINERLFDDTFYDYGNAFSIMATKLPIIFEKMSDNGEDIQKKVFYNFFENEYKFNGDLDFIYEYIDTDSKESITWDEFIDFFLPFIRYITV